jgi:hypothetical protein
LPLFEEQKLKLTPFGFKKRIKNMSLLKSLSQNKYVGKLIGGFVSNRVNKEVETITTHFDRFLEPIIASSQDDVESVYKIRHSVYCDELKFEAPKPSGMNITCKNT